MTLVITKNATINGRVFSNWSDKNADGLMIKGPIKVKVENCIFDRRGEDPAQADELASIINGAKAHFYRCRFIGSGKGVLVGTGDSNAEDARLEQYASFEQCIFEDLSRRHPMVNAGDVLMTECLIRNWGKPEAFYVKSYGIRACSKHARIVAMNCIFEQENLWACLTRGHFWTDIFAGMGLGFRKAFFAEKGGMVLAKKCHKNRWWLRLDNMKEAMNKENAAELKEFLENIVPKIIT